MLAVDTGWSEPSGAGRQFRNCIGSEGRSGTNAYSGQATEPSARLRIESSASRRDIASCTARTALTRRCSQRRALGKVTSRPRNASAAASMLLAENAAATLSSIAASRPGSLRQGNPTAG
jgi:hypothetical protein